MKFNIAFFAHIYKVIYKILFFHSNWYHTYFSDALRISRIRQHLEIINLGSSPGKYALDYSNVGVNGFNLAVGPQTLTYDLNVLKNYYSFLDEDGPRIALFPICPFSLCKVSYTKNDGDLYKNLRYYPFLHRAMIDNFDINYYNLYVKDPSTLGIKKLISSLLSWHTDLYNISRCTCKGPKMAKAAKQLIDAWINEFNLTNFDTDNLPQKINDAIEYNSKKIDEIIKFCIERDIKPVFLLTPISTELNKLIPSKFKQLSVINVLQSKKILFLDYSEDCRLNLESYLLNPLCLNKLGRENFTKQLIEDLKKYKYIK
ncbi:hypothetical protein [Xylanibacter oryzae]|uniref:hypothetical protein n=1 Tax=Xylanibacter oryzae TaxID=185293 RepID=UPI0004AD52BB|nr:hypothetical protein [Xylanibacter oryzae]